jgi:hypothetical protein
MRPFRDKVRLFIEGHAVENPPASIKYFNLMDNMKWAHLPVAGGIYDQHPQFLDELRFIFQERNLHQEKEAKRREAEQKRQSHRVAGGRR